jgi:hypothetical protein
MVSLKATKASASCRPSATSLIGCAAGALLLAAGCGVQEYEQRMRDQEERLQRFDKIRDEEAKYLGDSPLKMPRKVVKVKNDQGKEEKQEVAFPFDFFLLPPKGIKAEPKPASGGWFEYGGSAASVKLYLAESQGSPDAWRGQLIKSLGGPSGLELKREKKQPLAGKAWEVAKAEFPIGNVQYIIYFWHQGADHVAVAFEVPKDQVDQPDVKRQIETSLLTLAIGSRAGRLRSAYGRGGSRTDYLRLRMLPR